MKRKDAFGKVMMNSKIGATIQQQKAIVSNVKKDVTKIKVVAPLNAEKVIVAGGKKENVLCRKHSRVPVIILVGRVSNKEYKLKKKLKHHKKAMIMIY